MRCIPIIIHTKTKQDKSTCLSHYGSRIHILYDKIEVMSGFCGLFAPRMYSWLVYLVVVTYSFYSLILFLIYLQMNTYIYKYIYIHIYIYIWSLGAGEPADKLVTKLLLHMSTKPADEELLVYIKRFLWKCSPSIRKRFAKKDRWYEVLLFSFLCFWTVT